MAGSALHHCGPELVALFCYFLRLFPWLTFPSPAPFFCIALCSLEGVAAVPPGSCASLINLPGDNVDESKRPLMLWRSGVLCGRLATTSSPWSRRTVSNSCWSAREFDEGEGLPHSMVTGWLLYSCLHNNCEPRVESATGHISNVPQLFCLVLQTLLY